MNYTKNYNFPKPEYSEFADIEVLNSTTDKIDSVLKKEINKAEQLYSDTGNLVGNTIESAENAAKAVVEGKADKAYIINSNIPKSLWTGEEAPYTARIPVEEVTGKEEEIIEILVSYDATSEQKLAWSEAGIISGTAEEKTIILEAFGEKPEVDIPVCIIKEGDAGVINGRPITNADLEWYVRYRATGIIVNKKSTELSLSDSSDSYADIQVHGKTQQTQTNGYQLFDASKLPSKSAGGATVTNNGDGSFTVSGSGNFSEDIKMYYRLTHSEFIKLFKQGNLTLKTEKNTNPYIYVDLQKDGSYVKGLLSNSSSAEQSVQIEEEYINDESYSIEIGYIGSTGGIIRTGTIKPMLYQDGDGTWEPFSNGVASPSPDWEQRIAGVGDMGYFDGELLQGSYNSSGVIVNDDKAVCSANKIKCKQGDKVDIVYGENDGEIFAVLFKDGVYVKNTVVRAQGINITDDANEFGFYITKYPNPFPISEAKHISVTINGKYASRVESNGKNICPPVADWEYESSANRYATKIFLKGGKEYCASSNIPEPSGNQFVYYFLNTGNAVSKKYTKTYTPQKDEYIDMYAYMGRAYSEDALKGIYYIQIEEAEAPTEYAPYRHTSIQFPLTNPLYDGDKVCYVKPGESYIDENGDTVVADRMLYGHYHENGRVILDGSEDENIMAIPSQSGRFQIGVGNAKYMLNNCFCNLLQNKDTESVKNDNSFNTGTKLFIRINKFGSDVEALKTWLQSNNLEVVYKLARPWFEPFEFDDNYNLYNFKTFYPYTSISGIKNSVQPEIEVNYVADTENYIAQNYVEKTEYQELKGDVLNLQENTINNL